MVESPPFAPALSIDMGSDHAGRAGQRVKDVGPNALAAPTIEAVVNRRVGAVVGRAIPPPRTRTQHVHDPTDDPAIIDAMRAAPAAWHQRLNPRPLRVTQPIELLPHQGLLDSEALNHNSSRVGILIEYRP